MAQTRINPQPESPEPSLGPECSTHRESTQPGSPLPWPGPQPKTAHALQDVRAQVSRTLSTAERQLTKAYQQSKVRVIHSYEGMKHASSNLAHRARDRARIVRDEHPLKLVAALGAAALVTGILLRIWRSSRYE